MEDIDEEFPSEAHANLEAEHLEPHDQDEKSDGEDLHPDMVPYMFMDTDSESEDEACLAICADAKRVRSLETQPEYQRLKDMGLHTRPHGCVLGCHPAARVYRAWSTGSKHFSRSFGGSGHGDRTPWQALLRVMELMLQSHLDVHVHDKLAKKQLVRIQHPRAAEPPHAD